MAEGIIKTLECKCELNFAFNECFVRTRSILIYSIFKPGLVLIEIYGCPEFERYLILIARFLSFMVVQNVYALMGEVTDGVGRYIPPDLVLSKLLACTKYEENHNNYTSHRIRNKGWFEHRNVNYLCHHKAMSMIIFRMCILL